MNLEHVEAVTYQSYTPQTSIQGVWRRALKKFRSLEGWFMEHMRLTDGFLENAEQSFSPRQISYSKAVPGRINAFHIHPLQQQDELWCVIDGLMTIWLIDLREGSPTQGARNRINLSGEEPTWLFIPMGVAHGYKAGAEGALLAYATNNQFDWQKPNEGRLPWDFFGAELWDEDRG